jgi:hypothetical protein
MNMVRGSSIAKVTPAQKSMVIRQPQTCTRYWENGERINIPIGQPVATIPWALPLFLTNQRFTST